MSLRKLALSTAILLGLGTIAVSAGPLGEPLSAFSSAKSAPLEKIQYLPGSGFPNPRMRGAVVDWCSTWSNNCGPGGATLFCQTHGFQRALGWDVIAARHTYVIGANRFCDADWCKGYSFIRCG